MLRAIVLSGGGAKGAYEIGVWKALRKLKIRYNIVTGTSVGALNGAFMVQGDYLKALKMWENINFDMIFKDGFQGNISTFSGVKDLISMYGKGILKGGMDVSKLEETINNYINPTKFYNSDIKYGLVTVNLSNLKPISLTKENIPRENLKDYLMASATCFPAFKTKKINQDYYVDGGYYDNMPIALALDLGATEVIAVDIGGKQLIPKKSQNFDIPITYIKPKNDIGSFLVFDKKLAVRNMKLGFNDTMKIYKKYEGEKLTFKKREIQKLVKEAIPSMKEILENIVVIDDKDQLLMRELKKIKFYQNLLNDEKKLNNAIKEAIEVLGLDLEIDETKVYQKNSYKKAIVQSFHEIKSLDFEQLLTLFENKDFYKLMDKKILVRYGYEILNNIANKQVLSMMMLADKEFFACLYLKTILK